MKIEQHSIRRRQAAGSVLGEGGGKVLLRKGARDEGPQPHRPITAAMSHYRRHADVGRKIWERPGERERDRRRG